MIGQIRPDEIYNLGAQSHVAVSFEAEYTANCDGLGTLGICSRPLLGLEQKGWIYQASTSGYGLAGDPAEETTLLST